MIQEHPKGTALLADELSHAGPRPVSVIHCFEFLGRRYGYLVRTGDLIHLSEPAYLACSRFDQGADVEVVRDEVTAQFGADVARETMAELERLLEAGYLKPEVEFSSRDTEQDVRRLLAHQPRNIMFLVTEACNLACTYCYELNQGVHSKARMLKQVDARKIIDQYLTGSTRKSCTITFFGGEPLLNFPVIEGTVEYALQRAEELGKEVDFTMTTNLTLMTEEIADFLARHGFHVMVSLDGDREGNDRYRKTVRGEGTYDTAVGNLKILIRKMKEHGTRLPKIRATLTAENDDPIAVEEHLRSLGTHLVMVGETVGTVAGGKQEYDISPTNDTAERAETRIDDHMRAALVRLEADPDCDPGFSNSMVSGLQAIHQEVTREAAHQQARPSLCGVCRNMKAVTPTGDIYPCHRYVGMDSFKFGNVHEGGADPEKVKGYYEDIYSSFQSKCASCWVRHLCGGQCPWYLSNAEGDVLEPDEQDCNMIRSGYERRFGLYAHLLENYPKAFQKVLAAEASAVTGKGLTEQALPEGSQDSCQS